MASALEMASAVGRVPVVIVAVMMAVGMAVVGMAVVGMAVVGMAVVGMMVVGMMVVGMMVVVILAVALVPARRNTPASAAEKRKNDGGYASRGAEAPLSGL